MANQTITTDTNFDALVGLLAGETTTINGGATLTIDSDPQLNRVLPGNITVNDGVCFIDGTKVRELDFSGASVLPAIGDTLTAGSVTGQVIGVLGTTTAGSVRLRSLNGSIANGTALSFTGGKTATAASDDRVGWLNILGSENRLISISRLGEMRGRGQWYELGVSNGTASQTIQHYCTTQIGAIWVETGNGTGIYEIWVNAGSRFPASVGIAERGRYFGMSGSTITLGDGINGNIPANGARIRVPNITIGSALSAAPTTPTINTLLSVWWELSTTGGLVDFDKVSIGAFYVNTSAPQGFSMVDCGALLSVICINSQIHTLIERVGIGGTATIRIEIALDLQNSINVSVKDCHIARPWTNFDTVNPVVLCQSMSGVLERNLICLFNRQLQDPCVTISSADNVSLIDCSLVGGRLIINSSFAVAIKNTAFSDRSGTSTSNNVTPMNAITIEAGSRDITIDGYRVLSSQSLTFNYFIRVITAKNVKIRNIDYNAANHTAGLIQALLSDQIYVSNCSAINSRIGGIAPLASAKNLIIQNCSFGYNNPIFNSGLDMQQRSLIGGSAGLNTTTGIRVSQPGAIGTHFVDAFTSATTGALVILGNEKSTNSPSVFSYDASTGVRFNGIGGALLRNVGDQITWTWPWFILGHTGFANIAAFSFNGTNQTNHSFEYRLDTGSGFSGSWKVLSDANLSAEIINSNPGFRLQVRATCVTANINNAINGILIPTLTTVLDQAILHPPIGLVEATLSFTGLIPGSEIRIFRNSDSAELAGVESSGTTFSYTYTHTGTDTAVTVNIIKPGYVYQSIPLSLTASSNSLPIQQRVDYSYA